MHIFTDSSTANKVEKTRRVMQNLAAVHSPYFFDDGYPRAKEIANDALAAVEVVDHLRGLLMLALYHHQGGSSPVGQPIRRAFGIGAHDDMTPEQIAVAKAIAAFEI